MFVQKNRLVPLFIAALLFASPLYAQDEAADQSRESMAQDPTAAQWSFQLAYQAMPDYKTDKEKTFLATKNIFSNYFNIKRSETNLRKHLSLLLLLLI